MTGHTPARAGQLWTQFAAPLRAFVARRVPPGVEPDDVVQEVFLRVIRHLDELRDADRLHGWLFQIARNVVHDALRSRQRRDSRTESLETDLAGGSVVEQASAEAELAPCLTPLIARLAEPYRTAITLTSGEGLTQTEAARRAGVSVSGMKSRVQRAREQLKRMLLECCEVAVDRRGTVFDYRRRGSREGRRRATGSEPRTGGVAACGGEPACAASTIGMVASIRGERRLSGLNAKPQFNAKLHFAPTRRDDMSNGTNRQNTAADRSEADTCCGGRAPAGTEACCVRDAEAKTTGGSGCGCGSPAQTSKVDCCA